MTCLLPSPKGIWKCGPRYKFGRSFRFGMSNKSNCQEFQVKTARLAGEIGEGRRGTTLRKFLSMVTVCAGNIYIAQLHISWYLNRGGAHLKLYMNNFSTCSSVALSSFICLNNV